MKLPVRYLLPDMVLGSPVIGKNKQLLLNKGVKLTTRTISAIKKHGILVADVEVLGHTNIERKQNFDVAVSLKAMNVIDELAKCGGKVDYKQIKQTVNSIIEEILEGKMITENLTNLCSYDVYTYAHCVDVCILSVATGVLLKYDQRKLFTLGAGSLLHDIGKIKVPPQILNKPYRLTKKEFEEMKKHSEYGYQMAKNIYDITILSREIILNHHEKYDGSGYPRGLKGNLISDLASICSVADVYNAMTTDRIYRKALPPHEAYEMIMASGDLFFKNKIVEAFLKLVKPYPIGSVVSLSNGQTGIVVDLKDDLIFRPVVKIFQTNQIINLKSDNTLVISGLLDNQEVQKLALTEQYIHHRN